MTRVVQNVSIHSFEQPHTMQYTIHPAVKLKYLIFQRGSLSLYTDPFIQFFILSKCEMRNLKGNGKCYAGKQGDKVSCLSKFDLLCICTFKRNVKQQAVPSSCHIVYDRHHLNRQIIHGSTFHQVILNDYRTFLRQFSFFQVHTTLTD